MGTALTKHEEIRKLRFEPLPTRATNLRMVRVDTTIAATSERSGCIYTNSVLSKKAAFILRRGELWRHRSLIEALHRLGVITDEAHGSILELEKKAHERERNEYDIERTKEFFKRIGVALNAMQKRRMDALLK